MKVNPILIILTLSLSSLCGQPILIKELYAVGSSFDAMLGYHLENKEKAELDSIPSLVVFVHSKFNTSDGINKRIIDSLYSNNSFPDNYSHSGYYIIITSMSLSFSGFCNLRQTYQSAFVYDYKSTRVLILSDLMIDFSQVGESVEIELCGEENDNYLNPNRTTIFELSKDNIWVINRKLLYKTSAE